jgi:hypothetical protein
LRMDNSQPVQVWPLQVRPVQGGAN